MQRLHTLFRRLLPLAPANGFVPLAAPTPLDPDALKNVSGGLPNGTWGGQKAATIGQKSVL